MDDVTIEHRLGSIESKLDLGFARTSAELKTASIELAGVKDHVKRQNGRIGKLEDWQSERREALAREQGAADGRAQISKTQLALLAAVGPAAIAALDIIVRFVLS